MARKATSPAPNPEPFADPAPALSYEMTPIALLQRAPRTRDEVAVRDEVRKQIAAIEDAVVDFVAVKQREGFSLDEAFALFSLELPLVFAYEKDRSRIRARYGFRIIERAE
ncbi:hypothetical protein ACC668_10630 [Rhizobium ruizarguesonis]